MLSLVDLVIQNEKIPDREAGEKDEGKKKPEVCGEKDPVFPGPAESAP